MNQKVRLLKDFRLKQYKGLFLIIGIGFFIGMISMNVFRKQLLDYSGLLSEYTLYNMKYMEINNHSLFLYVLQKRVGLLISLVILSTTWIGMIASVTYTAWFGFLGGMLCMASLLRYGIKGLLLIILSTFPQGCLYIPAILFLIYWCNDLYKSFFYQKNPFHIGGEIASESIKSISVSQKILQLVLLLSVVIIGCFLESYVNPSIVTNLLKIF